MHTQLIALGAAFFLVSLAVPSQAGYRHVGPQHYFQPPGHFNHHHPRPHHDRRGRACKHFEHHLEAYVPVAWGIFGGHNWGHASSPGRHRTHAASFGRHSRHTWSWGKHDRHHHAHQPWWCKKKPVSP
jgi:hypothetical protein